MSRSSAPGWGVQRRPPCSAGRDATSSSWTGTRPTPRISGRSSWWVGKPTRLRRLGLLDGIVGQTAPAPSATATCYGKVIDETISPHYGFRYEDMVNAARAQAAAARFVTGRVAQISTGPDRQRLVLADGTVIEARLVVLATGPNCGDLLPQLGIERRILSEHHSLTLGFDVQTASRRVLVCYGERAGDGMGYLTVFPIGDTMRANLFCYRAPGDPWVKSFKRDPKRALLDVMPSLERLLGPFEITGKVQVRPNSIHRAENVRRQAGMVLIGDAFQSSCPAVGKGVGRILADLEVLRRLVPAWLEHAGHGRRQDRAVLPRPGEMPVRRRGGPGGRISSGAFDADQHGDGRRTGRSTIGNGARWAFSPARSVIGRPVCRGRRAARGPERTA